MSHPAACHRATPLYTNTIHSRTLSPPWIGAHHPSTRCKYLSHFWSPLSSQLWTSFYINKSIHYLAFAVQLFFLPSIIFKGNSQCSIGSYLYVFIAKYIPLYGCPVLSLSIHKLVDIAQTYCSRWLLYWAHTVRLYVSIASRNSVFSVLWAVWCFGNIWGSHRRVHRI